ncbi:MAG TPA: glycoside hydrolase family 3 C-terminal domain-containing protein [Firmicutes bacterium]|nr:glycoside hydrolase family 3 C-terminal domain-containing protein [Bacillota bacterium]
MNKKRVIALTLSAALLCGAVPGSLNGSIPAVAESAPGNIELSRQVATEGMVLLKNDNSALPLPNGEKVVLFGEGQIYSEEGGSFIKGGTGSGNVVVDYVTDPLEGMANKDTDGKVQLDTDLGDQYRQHAAKYWEDKNNNKIPDAEKTPHDFDLTEEMVAEAQKKSDTAIIMISRNSGEGSDRSSGKGDYLLSDHETAMLDMVCGAGFEHVVVVLNIGYTMDTSWIDKYPAIDSVLLAWQPGMEGGNAIADVLCGDVNPSGKLTDTFAKSYDAYPSSSNFDQEATVTSYEEDIYVGYRYFETFDPEYETVMYPFGYGLSYTTFDIDNVKVANDAENITVTADVTNTGDVAGKEVVQVYYSAPQGKLGNPAKELAAFQKTDLLEPGDTETVTMTYAIDDMASYDDTGKTGHKSAYILEAGDYNVYVGNSIKDAGEKGIRGAYTVEMDTVTEQLTARLTPNRLEKRLLANGEYEYLEQPTDYAVQLSSTEEVKIEAEDYYKKQYHVALQFSDNPTPEDHIAAMYIQSSSAGNRWLDYAVVAPEAGPYAISLGVGNQDSMQEDGIAFRVNNAIQPGIQFPLPSTGGQFNIRQIGYATLQLKEGLNFIRVEFKQGDTFRGMLDYITIKPGEGDMEIDPIEYTTLPAAGLTFEAESFADKSADVQVETITAGDAAGGKSLGWLHTGGLYISYAFDVQQAGTYRLTARAAHGLGGATDAATCYVNSVEQEGFEWTIPETKLPDNQYFNFIDLDAGTIELPEGKCIVQIEVNDGKNMGNIDSFALTPVNAVNTASVQAVSAKASVQTLAAQPAAADTAAADEDVIMFADVVKDPSLMDVFVDQLSDEDLVFLSGGHAAALPEGTGIIGYLPEYGIPGVETVDGPAGVRLAESCTAFPVATLLACTWDPGILEEVGKAIAVEAKQNRADVWLSPAMNIHRNPLCGRNFEYYSEDPLISGKMAAALTRGVQSEKVAVAVKHFAANNRENERGYQDSRVSERALREIYLKGFEICVKEADPWTIMSSYNLINGVETSESVDLLTHILREEWGFKGMVMTDWWNDSTAAREANAGNDIKMGTPENPPHLLNAVKAGMVSRETMERNVTRILEMISKTNAVDREIINPTYHTVSATEVTRIKAADWSERDINVGMELCEDVDGGYNPKDTYEGRYLNYRIDVEKAGEYILRGRVASTSGGGNIQFSIDGQTLGNLTGFPNTGAWQVWADTDETTIKLPAGKTVLRLDFIQGGFNINWFELERVQPELDVTVRPRDAVVNPGETLQMTAEVSGTRVAGDEEIVWSVEGGTAGTTISDNGLLTVAADETAASLQVTAAIEGRSSVEDTVTVTVQQDLALTIDQQNAELKPGETLQMTAQVSGGNATGDEVIVWSVEGGAEGTSISADGLLTVAADETAESLQVTATIEGTSVMDQVTVTITQGEAVIKGDCDGDGDVDIQDVMSACRVLARANTGVDPKPEEMAAVDMNGDETIDIQDIMLICRVIAASRQTSAS